MYDQLCSWDNLCSLIASPAKASAATPTWRRLSTVWKTTCCKVQGWVNHVRHANTAGLRTAILSALVL